MRLVNVGAANRVRNQDLLGYPVCLVCGHSRSPMGDQAEIDEFNRHHTDRCGRTIEFVSFYADVIWESTLQFAGCSIDAVAYSVLEALRQGAAEVLDMEISISRSSYSGSKRQKRWTGCCMTRCRVVPASWTNCLSVGPDVVKAASAIVSGCASACETSCIDCLQHFRNAFYHDSLDRHLAYQCFAEWGDAVTITHQIPPQLPNDKSGQKPINDPEASLVAMLIAAGLDGFETERPIKLSGEIVTRPDVYFNALSDHFDGVCISDGMSGHIHGNQETAVKDRIIRELRSKDFEVVEIMYQQLDKVIMRNHIRRIAKAVLGREKAKEIEGGHSWFT